MNKGNAYTYPLAAAHEIFERQAATTPAAIALVCRAQRLTYSELNERANRLAHRLHGLATAGRSSIGLYMPRSAEAIVSAMAILKAGHVCVPLDLQLPAARRRAIIDGAQIAIVVSHASVADTLQAHQALTIVTIDNEPDTTGAISNVKTAVTWMDPAYVSYTSGSTGVPKGAVFSHRYLCHYMPFMAPDDVCALNTSLAFGASVTRVWPPLLVGATLVVIPEEDMQDDGFLRSIEREQISTIGLVPSALRQLLAWTRRAPQRASSLRRVTIGGATLTQELVHDFATWLPHATLIYGYGGTETGPVTLGEVTPASFEATCVGRPVPNTRVLILDDAGHEVSAGEVGEICVASPHLALGYLNNPELTGRRFVNNAWTSDVDGPRVYRTGDLGRWRADGLVQWAGRIDHQVKIRGCRVELHEVEAHLLAHADIGEAAVSVATIAGENHLIAYVAGRAGVRPRVQDVREYAAGALPSFMVPSSIVVMEALPHTLHGKIDRQALPAPQALRPIDTPLAEPRTEAEGVIAGIWQRLLAIDAVGIDDHFLELGGDSLFATQALTAVLDHFGIEDASFTLFDRPTVADVARELAGRGVAALRHNA